MADVSGIISRQDFLAQTLHDDLVYAGSKLEVDPNNPKVAIIRTSDRITFKKCRRRWGWSSHLRHNLGPKQAQSPLWLGSGFHFGLEDFHGYNRFGHPRDAFLAYIKVFKDHFPNKLPERWELDRDLGVEMLEYYILWLQQQRDPLRTFWFNGEPQVEVNFRFEVPFDASKWGYEKVIYSGTIDRVVEDENGLLWFMDYKTAKAIQTLHYLTDPQVSVYMWAGPYIYGREMGGFIYQQHRKTIPRAPTKLVRGGVSIAQNMSTSRLLYKQTLEEVYGTVESAPRENIDYLNGLTLREHPDYDDYIRRDKINRNSASAEAEGTKILLELEDMLNPDLPLYPNPDRDCAVMCSFHSPCVSLDDGSDWRYELDNTMEPRPNSYDPWRSYIKYPGDAKDDFNLDFLK